MKKLTYILAAFILVFLGCQRDIIEGPVPVVEQEDIKVPITLSVRIPTDAIATKAMADDPQIKNMVIAVFGGSGYFTEWVPVTVFEKAEENYNEASGYEMYHLKFSLSQSESRLRLHLIANCPAALYSNPPITGVSSQDLEDVVMSKIRSQISDEDNDGYWAKILLPYGIQIEMEREPNTGELRPIRVNGEYVPTEVTKAQIERYNHIGGIPMVRNFARIYLKNRTTDWTIQKFCLAYAPAEGVIAPILPSPITTDEWGDRVVVEYASETDETGTVYPIIRYKADTPPYDIRELTNPNGSDQVGTALTGATIYTESFFVNYQNFPMNTAEGQNYRKLTDAPYNYGGYSPANQAIGTYPADENGMTAWTANTPLYIYERAKPASGQKATRIIIKAYKTADGASTAKYYPLDLTDASGAHMAFLRNFTYTAELTGIADGSGYDSIEEAADATGANVALDERTADLSEVSDGASLIAVSYIDATYMQQGSYDLYFHYEQPLGTDNNNTVTLEVGYGTGLDFQAGTIAGNGSAFDGTPTIEKNGSNVVLYVRSGNNWAVATADQIADSNIEKWGKIRYTTATKDRNNASAINTAGYYTKGFTQTIRVWGGNGTIFRDVLINLTPLKTMRVECLDKYIVEGKNIEETVRVYIPADLTRSMFPMSYKLELADYTLNPVPGSNMPVNSGASIIPGESSSKFYFIRTLTRDEYNELPTADGTKYFDCPFQTVEVASATTVYVANTYFVTASDDFHNYTQRLFTDDGVDSPLGGTISVNAPIAYKFYMDAAHSSGTVTWNDDENLDDDADRIIPHTVLITMEGLTPAVAVNQGVVSFVDQELERVSANVYKLTVPGSETAPSATEYTLHLVAGSEDDYSLTLSTSGNTPNPLVYADRTISGQIDKAQVTGMHFENAAGTTITRVLNVANQAVYFELTYGGELKPLTFALTGLAPDDARVSGPVSGVYTFTPADTQKTQRFKLVTSTGTASINDIEVDSEDYATPSPTSLSLTRYLYQFGNTGFYTTATGNTQMTRVSSDAGKTVYYRFTYDSEDTQRQDVTITAVGLTSPTSTTGTFTSNGDHTWTFHPTTTAQTHTITWTTEAVASGSTSSVTVAADLYTNSPTASINRRARVWKTANYDINLRSNANYNQNTLNDATSGLRVAFTNASGGGNGNGNRYKEMGDRDGWGGIFGYDYYNGQYEVSIQNSSLEGIKITGIAMAYSDNNHNDRNVTVTGDVSTTSQSSAGMTSWNSASTGVGNGDTQVTVVMSCSSSTEYSNRNRLTSIIVYYGYWDWE